MGYHRCEEEGCRRKGQTATNGCSLFCIAHMRKRGLEPRQKQCQQEGCGKQVATSTDGSRIYCWAHMKHHGLQPRQHKCTVKDCTKRVQTSSDGQRIYCISHMKSFNMKPRQPYCQYPGCKKRAHYSAAGQRTHCIAHMRERGLRPQPRASAAGGAVGHRNELGEDDLMAIDDGPAGAGTDEGDTVQRWPAPAQEPADRVPRLPDPRRQYSGPSSPSPTSSNAPSCLEELEDIELLKLAEVLLESGISFQEVLSLVSALQEHERSSATPLAGSPSAITSNGVSQPEDMLNVLGLELGQLLSTRATSVLSGSVDESDHRGVLPDDDQQVVNSIQQRLASMLTNHRATREDNVGEHRMQLMERQNTVDTPFRLLGSRIPHNTHTLGNHSPVSSRPAPTDPSFHPSHRLHVLNNRPGFTRSPTIPFPNSQAASPMGQSASTFSSCHPDTSTPLLHRSRTISSALNPHFAPDAIEHTVDASPSSSSLSSPSPSQNWNTHLNTGPAAIISTATRFRLNGLPASPRHHANITHAQHTDIQTSHAGGSFLAALQNVRAASLQPPQPPAPHPASRQSRMQHATPGLPNFSMEAPASPAYGCQVVTSVVTPQPVLRSPPREDHLRSMPPETQLQLDAHELSILDELSDDELLAVVMAAQKRLGQNGQGSPGKADILSQLLRKSEQVGALQEAQPRGGQVNSPLASDLELQLQQHAQRAQHSWGHHDVHDFQTAHTHNGGTRFSPHPHGPQHVAHTSQQSHGDMGILVGGARHMHTPQLRGQGNAGGSIAISEQAGLYSASQDLRESYDADAVSRLESDAVSHMMMAGQSGSMVRRDSYSQSSGITNDLLRVLAGSEVNGINRDQLIAELMLSLVDEEEAAAVSNLAQDAAHDGLGQAHYLQLLSALQTQHRSLSAHALA